MITEKAVAMPGCAGAFTMVAFNANDVPVGTVVYASKENELLEALEEIASGVFCDLKSVEEYAQRIINKLENKQ